MSNNHKITDIKVNKNNVKIFLDDEVLVETDSLIVSKLDLFVGKEINDNIVDKLKQEATFAKAKNDVIRFLSYRPRSEWEIYNKLNIKKYSVITIKKIISWLKEKNLINDREFSLMWIKERMANKPLGKLKIKNELRKKGITDSVIENIINDFFEKEVDELELAYQLVESKKNALKLKNIELEPKKIINMLKNRGFSYNVINNIYDDIINNTNK
jgi:regulatory protein